MTKPTLFMMMGLPGAGKTTISQLIEEATNAYHISSDKLRISMFEKPSFSQKEHDDLYKELDTQVKQLLQTGKSVIYDANLNRKQHRAEKYKICEETGATPKLVWVVTDKETSKERAIHPDRSQLVPPSETAEHMFERIASVIEEPDDNENPIIIEGTNTSLEKVKSALDLQ